MRTERTARFEEAVRQLGGGTVEARMGAARTLVILADEWLADTAVTEHERHHQVQTIIDALCESIRSPFSLAYRAELWADEPTGDLQEQSRFYAERAELVAEAKVRRSILTEIHERVRWMTTKTVSQNPYAPLKTGDFSPGTWSGFAYDFSGTLFFYPVDFRGSCWGQGLNLSGCTHREDANLTGSYYGGPADFSGSTYADDADFFGSVYAGATDFSGCAYGGYTRFGGSLYREFVNFSGSTFGPYAGFISSVYRSDADFSGCTYTGYMSASQCAYHGRAIFTGSTYNSDTRLNHSHYSRAARFDSCTYKGDAFLHDNTYCGTFNASGCTYTNPASFDRCTYLQDASFVGSTFGHYFTGSDSAYYGRVAFNRCRSTGYVTFAGSIFHEEVNFTGNVYGMNLSVRETVFLEGVDCSNSVCHERTANFREAAFMGGVSFAGVRFVANEPAFDRCLFNPMAGYLFNVAMGSEHCIPMAAGCPSFPIGSRTLTEQGLIRLSSYRQSINRAAKALEVMTRRTGQDSPEVLEARTELRAASEALASWVRSLTAPDTAR